MLTKVKPYFKVLPNILIIFLHNHSNVRFYMNNFIQLGRIEIDQK